MANGIRWCWLVCVCWIKTRLGRDKEEAVKKGKPIEGAYLCLSISNKLAFARDGTERGSTPKLSKLTKKAGDLQTSTRGDYVYLTCRRCHLRANRRVNKTKLTCVISELVGQVHLPVVAGVE